MKKNAARMKEENKRGSGTGIAAANQNGRETNQKWKR